MGCKLEAGKRPGVGGEGVLGVGKPLVSPTSESSSTLSAEITVPFFSSMLFSRLDNAGRIAMVTVFFFAK